MKYLIVLLLIVGCSDSIFSQNDIENSVDYYLLDRLSSFDITAYKTLEFGSYDFFVERKKQAVEGKKISITYQHQQSENTDFQFPTRLQILRNYSNAILKAGGRLIFERPNSEYGHYSFETPDAKEIWIEVRPRATGKQYQLTIIEKAIMVQEIVIDAELIKNKIEIEGKIAIYGIYFDTGKSVVKTESTPALEQIAVFLKDHPNINCWIVGHTDSDGSFEVNSKLSLDRATAIKLELETTYGITPGRLFAEGVGPLAPAASNTTEEGKKQNRRVELVKK